MTIKTNRESTKEIDLPKKLNPDVNPKDFTRKQAQTITPSNTDFDLIDTNKNFYFPDSKRQKHFISDYHHWGADKKVMEIVNKLEKSPETLWLIERRKEITKPGNLRFKYDSSLNRKVWVPQRPEKRGRDEVAGIDLELFFWNNEKNRLGGGYFDFNELKLSSSKEKPNTPDQHHWTQTNIQHRRKRCGEIFLKLPNSRPRRLWYRR